jgi:hypothetical protein
MITLSTPEWTRIRQQLKQDYNWKPSVLLIRETMRRELGFTTRVYQDSYQSIEVVCLDFYNDAAETMFRLKYLNRD